MLLDAVTLSACEHFTIKELWLQQLQRRVQQKAIKRLKRATQQISCLKVATKWNSWDPLWCLLPISCQFMILCVDRMLIGWKTTQSKSSVNHRRKECVKKKSQQRNPDRRQWTVLVVFNTFIYFCAAKIKEQPTFLLKRVNTMQSLAEPERQLVIEWIFKIRARSTEVMCMDIWFLRVDSCTLCVQHKKLWL